MINTHAQPLRRIEPECEETIEGRLNSTSENESDLHDKWRGGFPVQIVLQEVLCRLCGANAGTFKTDRSGTLTTVPLCSQRQLNITG